MKKTATVLVITLIVAVYSCRKTTADNNAKPLGAVTLDLPSVPDKYFNATMVPNPDSLNRIATLGRVLFYDNHLSLNSAISCGSCHKQVSGFADNAALSTGYEGRLTHRNSIGITSLSAFGNLFWDGREDQLQNLILRPVTNHVEMGIDDPDVLPSKLAALPYYSQLFTSAFGDAQITLPRISSAVSEFLQAIGNGSTTRLDEYQKGNRSALTNQEIYGKYLFDTKYPCGSCHQGGSANGGYSGGQTFKDIGLDGNYTDMGHGAITGIAKDNGTFIVPNLRNVALTAPYMHDGRYKTLDDVLEHYSHTIQNSPNLDTLLKDKTGQAMTLDISDDDRKAIIAFLGTLSDYSTATDSKFSNPFKIN